MFPGEGFCYVVHNADCMHFRACCWPYYHVLISTKLHALLHCCIMMKEVIEQLQAQKANMRCPGKYSCLTRTES